MTAADVLRKALETYEQRNLVYNDNYVRLGLVMQALFPDGLTIKYAKDWERLYALLMIQVKQTRYVEQWQNGGHPDSSIDTAVYAALQKEIDDDGSPTGL